MDRIALPVRIADGRGGTVQLSASGDVAGDLADAPAPRSHRSRLYLRLQEAFAPETLTPGGPRRALHELIDSPNGQATAAPLVLVNNPLTTTATPYPGRP